MRVTKEVLATSLFVRRVAVGPAPFRWEVHSADTAEPLHISPERFTSLADAYQAGLVRLSEFVPKRPLSVDLGGNSRWKSRRPSDQEATT